MSKEFQIRDGNFVANFDLENEDGDMDFCKLFVFDKGTFTEIGYYVDLNSVNDILKQNKKQISTLEKQLATMEKALELACDRLKNFYCSDYCGRPCDVCCQTEEELKEECKIYYKCFNKECILEQAQKEIKNEVNND